ncbi:MAG: AmmeMemoRadiSam system radical SAM enzyme [Sulfurimonadaceae bacterium]|jgi:pyruvate formate lyase activating enzyme|nr:AmmeMemoRadiSam system radical SAM enzyme [Sulfurimonadaceae bacterium]
MQYSRYKSENSITCILCRHYCTLKEGKSAICGVNFNENQKLVNKVYNHPSALNIDPIEKKPLYHFLPGSTSLSLGTVGCNFRCPFCQNYSISQTSAIDTSITYTPQQLVDLAIQHKCKSISYTYNEPTIWYPYARDIGMLAKKHGLKNVFVSNGYESPEVLEDMVSWVDAANIDLKGFSREYHKKVLKADLDGILDTLHFLAASPIHLEITTLLVPGHNDSVEEITQMAHFIATELGTDIPWHLSAFHPDYKMQDTNSTKLTTLKKAKEIGESFKIKHVYLGNVMSAS